MAAAGFTPDALVAELTNDPKSLGYSVLVHAEGGAQIATLATLLNAKSGAGAEAVPSLPIQPSALLDLVSFDEFDQLTTLQLQQLQVRMAAGTIKIGDPAIQSWFGKLFANAATTKQALAAKATTTGSRAEVLFGTGFVVTENEISTATATILAS